MSHAVAQKLRIPDCEGYLHKKGHLVPSWKRRYFALYGSELSYFESEAACSRMRSQGKVFKGESASLLCLGMLGFCFSHALQEIY